MAVLTEEEKAAMIAATHEAALVLADDLKHIRRTVRKKKPSPGDIRRLCAQLRRILLEGEISTVASPRIGRVTFELPDSLPIIERAELQKSLFAAVETAFALGVRISGLCGSGIGKEPYSGFADTKKIVRLDNFLADKVIYADGVWATRADVIKYISYARQGLHTKGKREPIFDTMDKVRNRFSIGTEKVGGKSLTVLRQNLTTKGHQIAKRHIDFILLHLYSTAVYLVNSPDVKNLEAAIRKEDRNQE